MWKLLAAICLAASLGGCGDDRPPADEADAAIGDDAPVDAVDGCTMTITRDGTTSGPCTVLVAPHGPHGYDAANFYVSLDADGGDSFQIRDFVGCFLCGVRAHLASTDEMIEFTGNYHEGQYTWSAHGPYAPILGSFELTIDNGRADPDQYYRHSHGTLDATLLSGVAPPATLHAVW